MIFTPINKIIAGWKPTIFYYLVSENLEISNPVCGPEEGRAAQRARVSGHRLSFGMKGKVARPSWASLLGGLSAPCGGQGVEWQWKESRPNAFVRSLAGSPPQSPREIIRETQPESWESTGWAKCIDTSYERPNIAHTPILWGSGNWAAGGMVSALCWGVIDRQLLYIFEAPLD